MVEGKPECPKCGSTNVYYRSGGWKFAKRPKGWLCRHCGYFNEDKVPLHGADMVKKRKKG